METLVLGVGAAGNKAVIAALENEIIDESHAKLLNTTISDIPEKYKNTDVIMKFSSGLGGCGKEPSKGKKAIFTAITTHEVEFGSIVPLGTKQVAIVTSTEGGTGSGATPVIAKYFEAMNLPVHIFAFIGFQDEARGINNTLNFFKELSSNIILHTIQNDAFKDYTGNYTKAEEAANEEFASQLEILIGSKMIPSSQNIDDTDHYKIATTPGYMDIKHIDLTGMKNTEMVDKAIISIFENGNNLDYTASCKRLAIIINASQKIQDAVDEQFKVIKRYTGEPFEIYRHIQNNNDTDYMDIIVSGLAYPEKSIIDMNTKYTSIKNKLNASTKGFDEIFADMNMDDDEDEFNMDVRTINKPSDAESIFSSLVNIDQPKRSSIMSGDETIKSSSTTKTTKVIRNIVEEY